MTTHHTDPAEQLTAWLATLRPGESQTCDALTLVPLYLDTPPSSSLAYLTLPEAHAAGQALVTEKPNATVPVLLLTNRSRLPMLILDGEEVVGGLQNRVVNTTLLIPGNTVFELDVTCVEHGRWHSPAAAFSPGEAIYPALRRQKAANVTASLAATGLAHVDQAAVWNEIAAAHQRRGTRSSTQAVHDVYLDRATTLQRAEDVLRCPDDNPVGVVALIGGQAVCADIFDCTDTLHCYWPRLVRSYALEAEGVSPAPAAAAAGPERLLAAAVASRSASFVSRGLGTDVRLQNRAVLGAALVCDESVVHTVLFATEPRATRGRLRRPSARAQRLRSRYPT